ncbi:MAG: polyprenyl synthetase family protein, partial [Angelakisella sp.]
MSEYTKYAEQYHTYMTMTEATLGKLMPIDNALQHNVNDAMSYSLLGGGKRLRGVLVLAFNKLCGGNVDDALPLACAAEMVHAYSLIHDDLPCMDNDELRRGKPTCHIRYGEAIALLAGDGLLTKAFETICAAQGLSDNCKSRAVLMLSSAAGTQGMIGGQVIDIESEGKTVSQQTLDKLHSLKTGALIRGAVAMGCLSANADAFTTECSDRFAEK